MWRQKDKSDRNDVGAIPLPSHYVLLHYIVFGCKSTRWDWCCQQIFQDGTSMNRRLRHDDDNQLFVVQHNNVQLKIKCDQYIDKQRRSFGRELAIINRFWCRDMSPMLHEIQEMEIWSWILLEARSMKTFYTNRLPNRIASERIQSIQ